jgi:hypothetical protein
LVYDVSDPTTPVSVGSYHSGEQFYDVKVAGTYAYLADRKGNLSQVNISNAAAPVLVGTYNAGSTPRSVFVAGKYAYLADDANGLAIVDINGIESPAANIASLQAGNANVADNLNVGGDAYIGNGLSVGLSGIFSRGALSVLGTTTLRNFTALNATTTSFGTNSLSIGSLNGVLQAVNGLVSASTTLSVKYGGTGSTTLTGLLVGNGLGSVQTAIVSSPLTITGNTLAIQQANGSQDGYLSSTDWNTFNNKLSSSSLASIFPFTPTTAFGSAANATSTLIGFLSGIYATASSTIGDGTQIGGLTINGGATTTGSAYIAGRLGIGTTSNEAVLQTGAGDVIFGGNSSSTGSFKYHYDTNIASQWFGIYDGNNQRYYGISGGTPNRRR